MIKLWWEAVGTSDLLLRGERSPQEGQITDDFKNSISWGNSGNSGGFLETEEWHSWGIWKTQIPSATSGISAFCRPCCSLSASPRRVSPYLGVIVGVLKFVVVFLDWNSLEFTGLCPPWPSQTTGNSKPAGSAETSQPNNPKPLKSRIFKHIKMPVQNVRYAFSPKKRSLRGCKCM